MTNTKYSYGIALVRFNKQVPEVLMVKKRYTYHFFDFVMGNYKNTSDDDLRDLFGGMTFQEKLDVLYQNYNLLWYRIWLFWPLCSKDFDECCSVFGLTNSKNMKSRYYKNKEKYDCVMRNAERVRLLINKSANAELIWEIPKGRKNDMEQCVNTALREFEEETTVSISNIHVLWNVKPIVETFNDKGVRYVNTYYLAMHHVHDGAKSLKPVFYAVETSEKAEIEDIRWMNNATILGLNLEVGQKKRLVELVSCIFSIIKSTIKLKTSFSVAP